MPTVQYTPDQVRTQVQGTVQARAVDNGGQQLAQGINSLAQMAGEMNKQATVAETQQAATSFEREKNKIFFDPENGYFNSSGRNAYEMAGDTTKRLEQLKADYGKDLSPRAQAEFNRVADAQLTRANVDIMAHSSKNLKAWQQSNIEAEVENSLENSSLYWNNMKQLNVQKELGRQSVLESAQMQGLSSQATNEKLQNYNSAFAMNTIKAAAQSSSADGDKAMELYGDNLEGPDKVNISEMLTKRREIEDTKAKAGEAVLRSNNLVSTFGGRADARTAMIDEINKIKDPEMQKMVKSEASYQLDQKLRADGEERANIVVQVQDFITRGGGSVDSYIAQNTEQWDKLRPAEKQALQVGGKIETDYIVYGELVLLNDKELAKLDPSDYRLKLGNTEYKDIVNKVKAARGEVSASASDFASVQATRSRAAQATSTVEQIFGKKSSWNDNERAGVNAFHGAVDNEVRRMEAENNRKLTSMEFSNVLNDFTRKFVVEKEYWFDSEQDIADIPADELKQISDFLYENNIPANVSTIFKAYEQAKKAK
jgi:hypothetical protein